MEALREGNLYKTLRVAGKVFEIRYGYLNESERGRWEPFPLFPDFMKTPLYTDSGLPFVTAEQDICVHYRPKPSVSGENWCNDCLYYDPQAETIGLCRCPGRCLTDRQNE